MNKAALIQRLSIYKYLGLRNFLGRAYSICYLKNKKKPINLSGLKNISELHIWLTNVENANSSNQLYFLEKK